MKKLLLTLTLILTTLINVKSQTIVNANSVNQWSLFRGGLSADIAFRLPVRDFTPIYSPPYLGRMQMGLDSLAYVHDGVAWRHIITDGHTYNNPSWIGSLAYGKLTGTPTIPTLTSQLFNDSDFATNFALTTGLGTKFNIPTGTTGQYLNGAGTPVTFPIIPAAQVNSDWNATSGVQQVLNKPVLGTAAFTNSTDYATSAQGSLANTALQPTGNGSGLTGLTKAQVNLNNVPNVDATNPANTVQTSSYRYVTDAEKTTWNNKQNAITLTTTGTGAATFISNTLNIPTPVIPTYTAGTGISIAGGVITNTLPDQTVTLTGANNLIVSGTYPNFTITQYIPTSTIVTRALNSNFTISTTKQSNVSYSISLSVTNPLLVGTSSAAAYLEYSINSGSTWIQVSDALVSSGVGVAVAVAITNTQTQILTGTIPANALVRIRTTTSGTASLVWVRGQETY